jgi:transcription-repair coupling factor (superfamily II helicase)
VERLDVGPTSGSLVFGADTQVDPGSLILLVQRSGRTLRFEGSTRLRFTGDFQEPEERFTAAQSLLGRLDECVPRLRTGLRTG